MDASEVRFIEHVVDVGRYPLTEPDGPGWLEAVAAVHQALGHDGCSVMPDFIRPSLLSELRQESAALAPLAYYEVEAVTAYNIAPDSALPSDHPGRVVMERGNAFVARDYIPADAIIHRLYVNPLFQRFVAACTGRSAVYPLADPLAGLCLNVVPPGRSHPWHFDTNECAVSLLTQAPESGGTFEYCPAIRSEADEHFADVRGVLDGARDDLVRRLTPQPGDLQLFMGRFSLHRVGTVGGDRARHSAIFAYAGQPGVVGSLTRTRQLFGRARPEHVAHGATLRRDQLLD